MVDASAQLIPSAIANIISSLLAISTGMLGFIIFRSDYLGSRRQYQKEQRVRLDIDLYKKRPTKDFYNLVPFTALTSSVDRSQRDFLRAIIVLELKTSRRETYDEGIRLTKQWLDTVGELAVLFNKMRLPLRPFLQTYHLGIIREGSLAHPFLINLIAEENMNALQLKQARAGAALVKLARTYNSLARQQRDDVFFPSSEYGSKFGPIQYSPNGPMKIVLGLFDRILRSLRLKRWRIRLEGKRLSKSARNLASHTKLMTS